MGRMTSSAVAVVMLLGGHLARAGSEVSQDIPGHGKVNFTDKTITATGTGAPNLKAPNAAVARIGAERTARLDALRNILETVKGVTVTGTVSAAGALSDSPSVTAKVQGIVQNFKVIDTKYYSDGGVDMIVEVPLNGVTDAFVGEQAGKAVPKKAAASDATGLIINAKGLSLPPAIAPRVVDEKGNTVYSVEQVEKAAVIQHGVAGYTRSLDQAMKTVLWRAPGGEGVETCDAAGLGGFSQRRCGQSRAAWICAQRR
ncbi:MAG: hypothetical protein R3C68_07830 [Myxococcota bacterium]